MRHKSPAFAAMALLLLAGCVFLCFPGKTVQGTFQLPADGRLPAQLGQTFVVGVPGASLDAASEQLLRYLKPGGIVLYHRNFVSGEQLANLIEQLQRVAVDTTGHRYLVMIDEEPGGATRLGLFRNVFAFGEPDWEQIDHDIGSMHTLGINVELAPLADFPFNRQSFVRRRVPAHTVDALTDFNVRFIALLKKHDIAATLKHFPGMGTFADDPHRLLPHGKIDAHTRKISLEIFRQGIASGAALVMTGHAVYGDLDASRPATLSPKIVTGLLREELKFSGLIITDDLSDMPFVTGYDLSLDDAAIQALEAGHSMVLFSHRLEKTRRIFDKILARAGNDEKLKSTIEKNCASILAFKESRPDSR